MESEIKKVFVAKKGKKYHLFDSCTHLKGREYEKIPLLKAKVTKKGICTTCKQKYYKNEGDLYFSNKEEKEKEKEEEEINNNININNRIKIEENKDNFSISNNSDSIDEENNDINRPKINLDDISGINKNSQNNEISPDMEQMFYENMENNSRYRNNANNNQEEEKEELNNSEENNDLNKKRKKDLNWTGFDFKILEETNKSSKLFFLKEIKQILNPFSNNYSLLEKNENNERSTNNKGNFKFKFEIIPYKELESPIKITLGFIFDYLTEVNISKKDNKKINLSHTSKMLVQHFYINKKTNNINVMINITKGKFFVIGKEELDKKTNKIFIEPENSEILFLENFKGIKLDCIKDVRPIFEYDKNSLELANIIVGGNELNND